MEEKLLEIIHELAGLEGDEEPELSQKVEDILDEIGLDEFSVALEDEYGVIIDPYDMEGKSIADLCGMIREAQ